MLKSDLTQFGIFAEGSRAGGVGIGDGGVGFGGVGVGIRDGVVCTVGVEDDSCAKAKWSIILKIPNIITNDKINIVIFIGVYIPLGLYQF